MVNPHHSLVRLGPHLPVTQPAEAELGLESRELTPDLCSPVLNCMVLGISLPVQVENKTEGSGSNGSRTVTVWYILFYLNFCQVCVR